jgi:DNA-binding NarL/FixJ family response regulator
LIFSTKIKGTAEGLEIDIRLIGSASSTSADPGIERILVDLNAPGTSSDDLIRLRQSFPAPCQIVAFGSHVDIPRLRSARYAGCDRVLPRSSFVDKLIALINPDVPLPD